MLDTCSRLNPMVWLFLRSPRPGGPHASVQSHLSHQAQGLKLQAVHKVAFHIGNFTVAWYGVLVAMAFLIGLWLAGRRGIRDGIPPEKIMDVGPWMILGT